MFSKGEYIVYDSIVYDDYFSDNFGIETRLNYINNNGNHYYRSD